MAAPEVTYELYGSLWRNGSTSGGLSEDAFAAALPEARARVDARCMLRDLSSLSEAEEAAYVRAVCAACELVDSPRAGSWSAGKASKSYLAGDIDTMTVDAAIERCLAGTSLGYAGV